MLFCFLLFLAAVVTCLVTSHNLIWALLTGLILFFLLGLRRGFSPAALLSMAWRKGRDSLIVVEVLLIIGTVTALWRACGTISFFLYYGLRGIPPHLFLLAAFLLSAVLSFALGTSFGVVGTVGVVLITLAQSGGVDLAVTAGAIISGAYFGDRCSPMSSCAMLITTVTGTELYHNVREMLKTAILPTALTGAFFTFCSLREPISAVDTQVLHALSENFTLHWLLLLPALWMLVLPLLRVPVQYAMAASAVTAFLLAVFLQDLSPVETLRAAVLGYAPAQPALRHILSGGGLVSMLSAVGVVFITCLYAGILEGIDALYPIRSRVWQLTEKLGCFPTAALLSLIIAAVFCNQSVTLLMEEQLLSESYRRRGVSRQELAIDISNSGAVMAALVPWSIGITVPLSILEVGRTAMPWCILLYLIPLCYLFTRRYTSRPNPISMERT